MNATQWSDHLATLAAGPLRGSPVLNASPTAEVGDYLDAFRDERGHRRAIDRPLLAHLLGIDPGPAPALRPDQPDLALWWRLHDAQVPMPDLAADGPLLGLAAFDTGTIETTTETELGMLHAAWIHAGARADAALRERCLAAARWHVDTLQPDNGTNHPWAVHVFVELADATGDRGLAAAASLHAETLVHNCMVSAGAPDRFSACLLLSASRCLDPELRR